MKMMAGSMGYLRFWKPVAAILVPLLLSPIPIFIDGLESRGAWLLLVMALFWGLELLHISATSLLPIVFLPLLGIMSTDEVCMQYFKGTCVMFFAGLLLAIAVEQANLHKRISGRILLLVGISPRLLMLGFMIPTAFLSMWISNTAATAMMIPVLQSVLTELEANQNTRNMMFLALAYSANCGGAGTLIGTGANLVLYGVIDDPTCKGQPISFLSWLYFAVPILIVNVMVCWIWLQLLFLGVPWGKGAEVDEDKKRKIGLLLRAKQAELGRFSANECFVSILFFFVVMLWFFRDPDFMTGWSKKITSDIKIDDATPAILICSILLAIPLPSGQPFLPWSVMEKKMNWGIILLVGGGFALAKGLERSYLNDWIGSQLIVLKDLNQFFLLIIILALVSVLTQVTNNTATASMILPVLKNLAVSLEINPLFLMLPTALTCSYAFVLPVSTTPNTIVFEASGMRTIDMVKAGIVLNFLCMLVTVTFTYTYGQLLFDLNEFPDWAKNCTTS